MLVCAYYCAFGTRDRGCQSAPGFPCALYFEGEEGICITRAEHAAGMLTHAMDRRVGKATTSAGSSTSEGGSVPTATKMVGTSQARLCPPYKPDARRMAVLTIIGTRFHQPPALALSLRCRAALLFDFRGIAQ